MWQDTLKSSPQENQVMKKATAIGVFTTTIFYMSCGILGYAAFGNNAPGNFLTGFGFYDPFWLVDLANICIAIHLIGAYQVHALIRLLHCCKNLDHKIKLMKKDSAHSFACSNFMTFAPLHCETRRSLNGSKLDYLPWTIYSTGLEICDLLNY